MENLFVSYDIALKFKQLGFDEVCFRQSDVDGIMGLWRNCYFNSDDQVAIPLYQQAINWLEKEHHIRICTDTSITGKVKLTIYRWNFDNMVGRWERHGYIQTYNDIYDANKNGIHEALKFEEKTYKIERVNGTIEYVTTGFKQAEK